MADTASWDAEHYPELYQQAAEHPAAKARRAAGTSSRTDHNTDDD